MAKFEIKDKEIEREIFGENVYQVKSEMIKDGSVVLDIGANEGIFCAYIAGIAQEKNVSGARVVAVEASPINIITLRENLKAYKDISEKCSFDIIQAAAFDTSNEIVSFVQDERSGSSRVWEQGAFQVSTISLNDLLKPFCKVDICKIDIEGSEYDLFLGASIQTLQKVLYFTIETHSVGSISDEQKIIDIANKLADAGFLVKHCGVPKRGGYLYATNTKKS